MAGIIHKIEEKLGMGGKKEGEKHGDDHNKGAAACHGGDHKPEHGCGVHKPEHKEGFIEKIKENIHGGEGSKDEKKNKKKKEKKEKKKHHQEDGHNSSSDSDSD
ncbi:hypothetical protein OROGR_017818 [Orobanche gracilis]